MNNTRRIFAQPPLLWGYFRNWAVRQVPALDRPPLLALHTADTAAYTLDNPRLLWDPDINDGWGSDTDQDALADATVVRVDAWISRGFDGEPHASWASVDDCIHALTHPSVGAPLAAPRAGRALPLHSPHDLWSQFEGWRLGLDGNLDANLRVYFYRTDTVGAYLLRRWNLYWVPVVLDPFRRTDPESLAQHHSRLAEVQAFIYHPHSQWRNPAHWNTVAEFLRDIGGRKQRADEERAQGRERAERYHDELYATAMALAEDADDMDVVEHYCQGSIQRLHEFIRGHERSDE